MSTNIIILSILQHTFENQTIPPSCQGIKNYYFPALAAAILFLLSSLAAAIFAAFSSLLKPVVVAVVESAGELDLVITSSERIVPDEDSVEEMKGGSIVVGVGGTIGGVGTVEVEGGIGANGGVESGGKGER
jgi:hypothetical protein